MTTHRDPIPDSHHLFGEFSEEPTIQEQIDEQVSNTPDFDQAAFAQFVVQVEELKCKLEELSHQQFYEEHGY